MHSILIHILLLLFPIIYSLTPTTTLNNFANFGNTIQIPSTTTNDFCVGDVDNDGTNDIVFTIDYGYVVVYGPIYNDLIINDLNNLDTLNKGFYSNVSKYRNSQILCDDVNNDGVSDITLGSQTALTVIVEEAGSILTHIGPIQPSGPSSQLAFDGISNQEKVGRFIRIGDLNNDGSVDLVVLRQGSPLVAFNYTYSSISSSSSLNTPWIVPSPSLIQNMALYDVDKDGYDDVVLLYISDIYILFGSSSIDAMSNVDITTAPIAIGFKINHVSASQDFSSIAFNDFNNDGKTDIALGLVGSSTSFVVIHYTNESRPNSTTIDSINPGTPYVTSSETITGGVDRLGTRLFSWSKNSLASLVVTSTSIDSSSGALIAFNRFNSSFVFPESSVSSLTSPPDLIIEGSPGDNFGYTPIAQGHLTKDNQPELIFRFSDILYIYHTDKEPIEEDTSTTQTNNDSLFTDLEISLGIVGIVLGLSLVGVALFIYKKRSSRVSNV